MHFLEGAAAGDRALASRGEQIALATLVAVQGSAPRRPGARMALTRSGRMAGSVSAGCVENDVFARALQVLGGEAGLARYGISSEAAFAVGLPARLRSRC